MAELRKQDESKSDKIKCEIEYAECQAIYYKKLSDKYKNRQMELMSKKLIQQKKDCETESSISISKIIKLN